MASKKTNANVNEAAAILAGGELPNGFVVRETGIPLKKAGDVLTGVYGGQGKGKMIRKKMVPTFIVNGGEILASAQLAAFFATCEKGDEVWIKRLGQVEGGKGRVNQYLTAVKSA